jgi:hypothetical protein
MTLTNRSATVSRFSFLRSAIVAVTLVGCSLLTIRASRTDPPNSGMADPVALETAFDRFAYSSQGNRLLLSLANLRGVSAEAVNAGGSVTVDLETGVVRSDVRLLPAAGTFDLWLIDNRPGLDHSTLADDADGVLRVGTFAVASGRHSLLPNLGPDAFTGFFPDRAFVVRSDQSPFMSFVLTGSSTLLDRLRRRQVRFVDDAMEASGFDPIAGTRAADFERVVAQGRQLFLRELALGRQEDFDLPSLSLKSPLARSGKALYLDTGKLLEAGHKNCNACHFNGGGTAAMTFFPRPGESPDLDDHPRGVNMTAETNANDTPRALTLGLPRDGGFGQVFLADFGSFGNRSPALPFGLEGFNSPPVVESADTAPFFHNHTVPDLESAVAFYGTPAFQRSAFGPVIAVSISPDPRRSRGAGHRRLPSRAERAGEHPLRDQRGGARPEDGECCRYARSGQAGSGGNRRCARGLVRGSPGETPRARHSVGARPSARSAAGSRRVAARAFVAHNRRSHGRSCPTSA